jgi:hypothetical protein
MILRLGRLDHRTERDGCSIWDREAQRSHKSLRMSEGGAERIILIMDVAEQACCTFGPKRRIRPWTPSSTYPPSGGLLFFLYINNKVGTVRCSTSDMGLPSVVYSDSGYLDSFLNNPPASQEPVKRPIRIQTLLTSCLSSVLV